jgi:O-methyltransferase involved in polyketide biosynthesis
MHIKMVSHVVMVKREAGRGVSTRFSEVEMSETANPHLSGVSETLLIPLYNRAMESQRPDAMLKDEKAVALVTQMRSDVAIRYAFDQVKQIPMTELLKVMRTMFTREFDRYARDFLRRHLDAVVVHIGCGLDTRFERVDDGRVEWYDLDIPDVIDLRRKLIGDETGRYHLLGCSVLEDAWLKAVKVHSQRPFLFLAETVFVYFTEAQVKSLVLTLREHFPGAELVFDAFSPFMRWAHNVKVTRTRVGAYLHWGLKHGQDLERWRDPSASLGTGGIRLLDERFPFQYPAPRIRNALMMRLFPFLATAVGVFHYQL